MQNESKPFGVKATNSFKKNFNQSILKLSFLYGAILVTILFISGVITFNEFSGRIGKRFNIPPTVTITLPDGTTISKGPIDKGIGRELNGSQINRVQDRNDRNERNVQMPTVADIRADLIASLIFVNGILLLLASIASYWLARLTLRPIQVAYERQRRFLGDASHELRTPLSILQIELENELYSASGSNREQILSKLEEVKRMSKLVGDLLIISRLDEDRGVRTGQSKVFKGEEFLKSIEGITARLSSLAESRKVNLKFIDATNLDKNKTNAKDITNDQLKFSVSINEDLLSHALTNVIQNAIFYNKEDGSVDVTVSKIQKKIRIEIKDNGIGISKNDLEHIFDRFFRADKSRTRKHVPEEGSGLGLSIAKSAILYMGGNLEIQSELHVGTTIHIEFPINN